MRNINRSTTEPNTASMADIAFLLLIFFMVTTTIANDKGLDLLLPPFRHDTPIAKIKNRNLFTVLINSQDKLLVENETYSNVKNLHQDIMAFVLNYGQDQGMSDSPAKAVVSIKANRGATQAMFIHVLDQAKAAYYIIYADRIGITLEAVRSLDLNNPNIKKKYEALKREIPMNISVAEPD